MQIGNGSITSQKAKPTNFFVPNYNYNLFCYITSKKISTHNAMMTLDRDKHYSLIRSGLKFCSPFKHKPNENLNLKPSMKIMFRYAIMS